MAQERESQNRGVDNMSFVSFEPVDRSSKKETELDFDIKQTPAESGEEKSPKKSFLSRIFKKKKKAETNMVPFFKLFRFATKLDILMMIIGTFAAMCNGATTPLMVLVFTSIVDSFSNFEKVCDPNQVPGDQAFDSSSLTDKMKIQVVYLVVIGVATMIFSYFQISFWLMPAERETRVIRIKLFSSILKQDIGWFDCYKSGELTTRLTEDVNKIKDGIGDKFGSCIQYFCTFLIGLIIGFIKGWKLTLVILSISPLLFISSMLFTKMTGVLTTNELKSYAKAGAVAEEVFSAVRTVFAFNGQYKECSRYDSRLDDAKKYGIRKGFINGAMMGFLWLVVNGAYALGFWYGWTLTQNIDPVTGKPEYTVGTILLIFFNIIIGIYSLGNAGPFASTMASARAAAFEIFKIIDREPPIDSFSADGIKPDQLVGNIEFKDVHFNYPARPDVKILRGVNLEIKSGTTVALVGSSGCGKSTCIQLTQRFYDPLKGVVTIDNRNIKELNLNWLRTQLGVVNQEPILFGTTIYENIKFGRSTATDKDIIRAAKAANAHDFIMTLPQKYSTLVGDRGSQLSGGQKQRIAIARALVRDPKILLLDEATSALDNESEAIVQAALDRARLGRTTIIVAHRLSTILNADLIYAFDKGKIVESGTHAELMSRKGIYYNLVMTQQGGSLDTKTSKFQTEPNDNDDSISNLDIFGKDDSDKKASDDDDKEKKKGPSIFKVLALNKPEWYYILIGCIASFFSGAVQPAVSIILAKAVGIFSLCDVDEQRRMITVYCVIFIVLGVVTFFSNVLQSGMFGVSGENLTKRLRARGFQTILKQEIGWFDDQINNVGSLCTKLATEASSVQGATGVRLGFFIMNISNFGLGLILSMIFGWTITLVVLAFLPLIVASGVMQTKMLTGFSSKDKKSIEKAGKITIEAISNIRTVAVLHKEKYFIELYSIKIKETFKASIKSANFYGFMLGLSNSVIFYAVAAAYGVGGYLMEKQLYDMNLERVMLVVGCVVFGAQAIGQASTLMPDYAKAKVAIINMFDLFERVPKINNLDSKSGLVLSEDFMNESGGNINLEKVEFTYPTRQEIQILRKLDVQIKKGQRVALVGASGCGKSTITQLVERFYDPDAGEITFCDRKLSELNLFWLRSQMGIVSQEPILFDMSIRENIAYGDNSREVAMDEIIKAAKLANIDDFIKKLPQGYETNVGSKGTQLSGGQKQRISIARALIRNPKILLLDEATSALDTESEKIVQEALEKAQEGRTCIIIAHRLSTIRNADLIFVLQNGVVTEAGNHEQLIALNGFYARLNGQYQAPEANDE